MKIIKDTNSILQISKQNFNKTIGFVPTMGALHEGHLSLCANSIEKNDITVASIFVNPTQFNNPDDLKKYPNTLEQDIDKLEHIGVDYLFLPHYQDIYHDDYVFQVNENSLSRIMEGVHRPGHFNGVLTVVLKLNNLVKPTHLYLGEKDYQQASLITEMFKAFFIETLVVTCPTVRDNDGLALSSRNARLTDEELLLSKQFNKYLKSNRSIENITKSLEYLGMTVEYIEEYQNRRYGAVKIGDVRLIDNVAI